MASVAEKKGGKELWSQPGRWGPPKWQMKSSRTTAGLTEGGGTGLRTRGLLVNTEQTQLKVSNLTLVSSTQTSTEAPDGRGS